MPKKLLTHSRLYCMNKNAISTIIIIRINTDLSYTH